MWAESLGATYKGAGPVVAWCCVQRMSWCCVQRGVSHPDLVLYTSACLTVLVQESAPEWTGARGLPVRPGDLVILGHVRDVYAGISDLDATWPEPSVPAHEDMCRLLSREGDHELYSRGGADGVFRPVWRLLDPEISRQLPAEPFQVLDHETARSVDEILAEQQAAIRRALAAMIRAPSDKVTPRPRPTRACL
jgi:hypothetical protein